MTEPRTSVAAAAASRGARLTAEGFGSFLIVFLGVGASLFTATLFADPGAGSAVNLTVALAFGIALLAAFSSFAGISGGHFSPAVTIGAAAAGAASRVRKPVWHRHHRDVRHDGDGRALLHQSL